MIKFLPIIFIMLSCSSTIPKETLDTTFSIIYKSEMGGNEKEGYVLLQNNESYIQFIESLKLDETEYAKYLAVDFKKKDILVLYQGQQTSGGYQIDIESLKNENKTIIVKKKQIVPKKGEMTTTVITSPYCIALIPKGNKLIIE